MNPDHFELVFFDDDEGREPCREFLKHLEEPKRHALEQALLCILAREGLNVCNTEWGKPLGKGLAEFRVRHTEAEIMRIIRPDLVDKMLAAGEPLPEAEVKVLLRVFFHAHGDKLVLLIGGYDKGKDPSAKRQRREIAEARRLLKQFQRRAKTDAGPLQRATFREYWRDQRVYWRARWRPGS